MEPKLGQLTSGLRALVLLAVGAGLFGCGSQAEPSTAAQGKTEAEIQAASPEMAETLNK